MSVSEKSLFYVYKPLQDLPITQNVISDNFLQKNRGGANVKKV